MNRATKILPVGPLVIPKGRRNKYNVSPPADRTFDGKVYASKAEMERAKELRFYIERGDFMEVVEQPRVSLGCRENVYVPDFLVIPYPGTVNSIPQGSAHYEDVKGMETAAFRKNLKLWSKYGRLPLHVLTAKRGGGWDVKVIGPAQQSVGGGS